MRENNQPLFICSWLRVKLGMICENDVEEIEEREERREKDLTFFLFMNKHALTFSNSV